MGDLAQAHSRPGLLPPICQALPVPGPLPPLSLPLPFPQGHAFFLPTRCTEPQRGSEAGTQGDREHLHLGHLCRTQEGTRRLAPRAQSYHLRVYSHNICIWAAKYKPIPLHLETKPFTQAACLHTFV